MTKKQSKANEAFGLLFGAEEQNQVGIHVDGQIFSRDEIVERKADAKDCYLIVMTGKTGTKINDLYDTTIMNGDKEVRLSGKHRLQGAALRGLKEAMNLKGIHGTMSIFNHTIEDAEELIHEHNRMMIKLAKNVEWIVAGRVNLSEAEIDEIMPKLRKEYHEKLIASGEIIDNGKTYLFTEYENRKEGLRYNEANQLINDLRLNYKHEQAEYTSLRLMKYIELV